MNKKLIASLLTLGLVLSPATASLNQSYATEASAKEENLTKDDARGLVKAYIDEYDYIKNTDTYLLADQINKDSLERAMDEAKKAIKADSSLDELKGAIKAINDANKTLAESAKINATVLKDSLKTGVVRLENLLKNHEDRAGDDKYKKAEELVAKAKDVLKSENYAKAKAVDLLALDENLTNLFTSYKEELSDKEEYKPTDEDYKNLETEVNKPVESSEDQKYEKLVSNIKTLTANNKDFVESDKFKLASAEAQKAYKDLYDKLVSYNGVTINKDNYDEINKLVNDLAGAKRNIDAKASGLEEVNPDLSAEDIKKETVATLKRLDSYRRDKDSILKGVKDENLIKAFNEAVTKAGIYAYNYANGLGRDLKDYKELEVKLKDLKEKIEKSKGNEASENKNLDDLKANIKKAKSFENEEAYKKADKDKQDKLKTAIEKGEKLLEKDDLKDEDIIKANKDLVEALKEFTKFADKKAATDALKKLLDATKGIKIEQMYGPDQKDAKEAYTKARDKAAKLVSDNKEASLDDMSTAYIDFKEAKAKLDEFLITRLENLVKDNEKFAQSEKYKEVNADKDKEAVIVNYLKILSDSEKALKEEVPDANDLNVLYNKLKAARDEIKGEISSEARKIADAIYDSYIFLESEQYKKAAVSSNKSLKSAANNYKAIVDVLEDLQKSGKIDKPGSKDLLDALNHAKDYINGQISEKAYLSNEYYYILRTIRDHKDYKNLNQALREKLEKAIKAYENNEGDEDAIFSALEAVMIDKDIKAFKEKIEAEKNPNLTRDKLFEDLTKLINEDKKLKEGSFKYQKAQKALRDAYDEALEEAKALIDKEEKASEDEVRKAYKKLLNAKNALDGDKFEKLINDLAQRFKKEQGKILNTADRKAIAEKINSLSEKDKTMDDALKVEKELDDLINKKASLTTTTSTLSPQGQVQTTQRPVSTITNPGSIVKTGVTGIAKVAAVLAVAAIILKATKKGDKNENNQ